MSHPYTNALIHTSSPYLQEHAHNPVNWYPWGEEALQKAKNENKPLIISIGYSACHWCHVMEHQSYADTEVADYMNEHFVAIKVDREERPDIDQVYMNASMLLTGSGGWPLNAFALPDSKPFYAVTYLPKSQWLELLHQIIALYRQQPEKIAEQAEALTAGIQGQDIIKPPEDATAETYKITYSQLFEGVKTSIDFTEGGFGRVPKFPMPCAWELLLQYHHIDGNEKALKAVTQTLDKIAQGGIYDQLGGGFARYATDQRWRVPHFEKMLYDNGQLVSLYAHAYQVTKKQLYADVVRQTLDFIQSDMTDDEGGFYAAVNADSEGEEGKFYVWTAKEIEQLPDERTISLVKAYYNITDAGNWEEGKNTLFRTMDDAAFAVQHQLTPEELQVILQQANSALFEIRSKRISPTTDHKILTSWNALMSKGFTAAYLAFGDKSYLDAALRNARFMEKYMLKPDGSLWRNCMHGKPDIHGMLDDYAFLADAFIALYEATFDFHWLSQADVLAKYVGEHFHDQDSGLFFYTSDNAEKLVARKKEMEDNVLPASNSVMAHVLFRLGIYFDREDYVIKAKAMLNHVLKAMPSAVPYFANWGLLLGMMQRGPFEIAVVGADAGQKARDMQRHYLPDALLVGGQSENLPLLENKAVDGQTTIYVCRDKVCGLPVTEIKDALQQIK